MTNFNLLRDERMQAMLELRGETEQSPTPAELFAEWLAQGPRLAKAAGCYVAITVTEAPYEKGHAND